jgi:PAS domain S-box-containing protein
MLIEGEVARFAHWNNYPANYVTFFNTFRLPLATPHLREMIATAAPVVITDTETYDGWVNIPDLSLARSYLGVPIRVHDRVIGFLNLDSSQPGYFCAAHVERLQAFADQAAIALENAQLYEEIRRHADTLEQQVRERTNELDQERAHLQAILEEMAEAVMYIDLATRQIQYANRAFAELTGYQSKAFIAQPLGIYKELLDIPEEYRKLMTMLERIVPQRATWRGTFRAHRKDGIPLDLELAASVVPGPGEQVAGVVILARDIGPERALQAQKDRFIANASHELRTPITNLTLRLYLARREPEKWQEYLPILENTANHMATLVESLLEVSRFERGLILLERRSVVLQDIIAAAVVENQPQAARKHIQITSKLQDEPLYVYVDPTRIRQVVDNLIINAINYTPDGGQINIEAFAEQKHGAAFAIFRIQDTGVGMTPEQIARLFEPFFRVTGTKTQGTGLGLSIAKEIINLHGGKIAAESEINKGSVFSVLLPLEDHEAQSGPQTPEGWIG